MACTLVETLFRRLHEYTFANGDLVSSGVMFDPFVVVEAQHHANVFLRRCNLEVVDVARLLDVSEACSSDNEEQNDNEFGGIELLWAATVSVTKLAITQHSEQLKNN